MWKFYCLNNNLIQITCLFEIAFNFIPNQLPINIHKIRRNFKLLSSVKRTWTDRKTYILMWIFSKFASHLHFSQLLRFHWESVIFFFNKIRTTFNKCFIFLSFFLINSNLFTERRLSALEKIVYCPWPTLRISFYFIKNIFYCCLYLIWNFRIF